MQAKSGARARALTNAGKFTVISGENAAKTG